MWGNIVLDVVLQANYSFSFPTTRTDNLLRVTQWQYWWWFWFTYFLVLYYFLAMRLFRFRTLKFRPRIVSSLRPHGKWGDLIICLLPISWCANILSNSNFLLRMLEWQAESSLFTLRVRGKQWYWVYKFELKSVTDFLSTPKNVGHNKWLISVFGDLKIANNYLHILQLRSQSRWLQQYWQNLIEQNFKSTNLFVNTPQELLLSTEQALTNTNKYKNINLQQYINKEIIELNNNNVFISPIAALRVQSEQYFNPSTTNKWDFLQDNQFDLTAQAILTQKNLKTKEKSLLTSDFNEVNRWVKKSNGPLLPLRIIKNSLKSTSFNEQVLADSADFSLFSLRFSDASTEARLKPAPHTNFLTLKQKRYQRKKIIPLKTIKIKNDDNKLITTKWAPYLFDNKIILNNAGSSTLDYQFFKKNKLMAENIPLTLAHRLLRTKRTLVLPAHVNISVITNSYDVVHSWFIPGLGVKLDCIPGRATHHVLHIDNAGFYYGQCAEICGRYHHHMPIRICALPFEHFLVWWQSCGLPKLLFTAANKKRYEVEYSYRKYTW